MIHGLVAALRMLYQGKSIKNVLRAQIPDFDQLDSGKLSSRAAVFQNSARLSVSDFPGSSGQHGHLPLSPPHSATPSRPFKGTSESGTNSTLALSRHYTPQAKLHYRRSTCKGLRGTSLLPDRRSRGTNRGSRGAGSRPSESNQDPEHQCLCGTITGVPLWRAVPGASSDDGRGTNICRARSEFLVLRSWSSGSTISKSVPS